MGFSFDLVPQFTISHTMLAFGETTSNRALKGSTEGYENRVLHRVGASLSDGTGRAAARIVLPRPALLNTLNPYFALRFSGSFGDKRWGRQGQFADLYAGDGVFIEARFQSVDHPNHRAVILVDDLEASNVLKEGKGYPLIDGYWGARARLVYEYSREWEKCRFVPRDATLTRWDGTKETVEDGWDHEHCAICWQEISPYNDGDNYGYRDRFKVWVCEACYSQYIKPKSLDFIPLDKYW